MYSVVLMAALTANAAEAPSVFKHSSMGCCGGLFAHSGAYASCMGCWGAGWGCNGGYWGSCYGGSGYGCYGGWDSGYGYAGGCWGSCHGGHGGVFHHHRAATNGGCYGCMGCYGSWAGYGEYMTPGMAYPVGANNPMSVTPAMPGSGTTTAPAGSGTPGAGAPGATTPPAGGGGTSAKLIIEKPADAKLFVDDQPVKADGVRNTFSTPVLDPSQAYYYMVRVEMDRDGKPVSETRRVIVRAGETVQETFREPTVTTALKLPAGR
jgi:uncharacterized protein (TIGR03000 family)